MKKVNWKNTGIFVIILTAILAVMIEGAWAMQSHANQKKAEVSAERFYRDNIGHYGKLVVATVPIYESKDSKEQQMVVVADFGTYVKGGYQSIVMCAHNNKNCNTPEGRKLINLDDRNDKEAIYYKRMLEKAKKQN